MCSFLFVHLDFFNLQDALCFNLLWKLKTGFNIETPGVSAAEKRVNKDSRDLNSNCLVTNYFLFHVQIQDRFILKLSAWNGLGLTPLYWFHGWLPDRAGDMLLPNIFNRWSWALAECFGRRIHRQDHCSTLDWYEVDVAFIDGRRFSSVPQCQSIYCSSEMPWTTSGFLPHPPRS